MPRPFHCRIETNENISGLILPQCLSLCLVCINVPKGVVLTCCVWDCPEEAKLDNNFLPPTDNNLIHADTGNPTHRSGL